MITYDQLKEIMPHAKANLIEFVAPLNDAMTEWEIDNPRRQAAFLAQVAHESGSFRYMEELASGDAYEGRRDLGNHELEAINAAAAHGTTPGRFYKGRSPIQVTGYYNYRDCGAALVLDLVNSPDLLTLPVYGCRAAGWFWSTRGCNQLADQGKFESITRRINGGLNGQDFRVGFWARASQVLNAETDHA